MVRHMHSIFQHKNTISYHFDIEYLTNDYDDNDNTDGYGEYGGGFCGITSEENPLLSCP